MNMSNKTYDILAYIGRIALPACATLYGTLAGIWNLPYGEAIVATISALALFLNALLKVSSMNYQSITFTPDAWDELSDGKGDDYE